MEKNIKLLILVAFYFIFQMCIPPEYDQHLYMVNGTSNDTLEIQFNSRESRMQMLPGKEYWAGAITDVSKIDEDNLKYIVDNTHSSIKVFWHDTCLVHWTGPMQNMGDTVHDFFNHDSWEGKAQSSQYNWYFTITKDDRKQPQEE